MNSSLQSLSHTPMLSKYFTSRCYTYDINLTNTMGMQGGLAAAYGELICEIWSTRYVTETCCFVELQVCTSSPLQPVSQSVITSPHLHRVSFMVNCVLCRHASIAPRRFKAAIGKFKPQFLGYEQHDAQELFSHLIDGLSEDLNRVNIKPYVENPGMNI